MIDNFTEFLKYAKCSMKTYFNSTMKYLKFYYFHLIDEEIKIYKV